MDRTNFRLTWTTAVVLLAFSIACDGPREPVPRPQQPDHTARGPAEATREKDELPPLVGEELVNMGVPTASRCMADASKPQVTDYAKQGPHAVATLDLTFEDRSRPIAKTAAHPAAASRTLETTVYYPTSSPAPLFGDALVAPGGPFPMLMYSHGFASTRGEASALGNRAASHGYIVVAADFPLSNMFANNGSPDPTDAPNQAGDLSFLIDRLLELSQQSGHVLANAVDGSRIGATGVSMGGMTTLLASFHPKIGDARIRASAPIAALSSFFMEGFYHTRQLPMLLVHGDNDAFIDYERNARAAWERAQPNAWLMTIASGTHTAFAFALDPATQALLNLLMGMPGSHPTNSDGLGCGAVGSQIEGRVPTFPPDLGGAQSFIDESQVGTSLDACHGNHYTRPAIDARRQLELTTAAVVSFFQAHLGKARETREDGCRYLLHVVPGDPDVTLE